MQARPTTLALGETPEVLFDGRVMLGVVNVYNPSADTVAYLKIWPARSTAPTLSTDAAPLVFGCDPGHTAIPLFAQVNGVSYWAATTGSGTVNTAPDENLVITASFEGI